jgi:hypothetical protein
LEINIYLDAIELVVGLPLTLELPHLLHLKSSCISVQFNLIDFVCCGSRLFQ